MRNKLQLFDPSVGVKPVPEKDEFLEQNMELLLAFPGFVDRAFASLWENVHTQIGSKAIQPMLPPTMMNSLLKDLLNQNFPELCVQNTVNGRIKLKTVSGHNIFVKKVDARKKPRNNPTGESERILHQIKESPDDFASNIFFGYTADEKMKYCTGCYAICRVGGKIIWEQDLDELQNKYQGVPVDRSPVTPTVEVSVRLKDRQANG